MSAENDPGHTGHGTGIAPRASDVLGAPGASGASGAATTHLLYLHGFRSSPRSFKAQRLRAWLAAHRPDVHWWCPQLPPSPAAAWAMIDGGTAGWPAATSAVAGSSLGGFYALAMGEARGWRALAINPAMHPARDLAAHVGEQTGFHDPAERFEFRAGFVDELRALEARLPAGGPSRLGRVAAVVAEGDEVLDAREAIAWLRGARLRVVPGSDHALSDVDDHLPFITRMLALCD